jgi:hypothetical protein
VHRYKSIPRLLTYLMSLELGGYNITKIIVSKYDSKVFRLYCLFLVMAKPNQNHLHHQFNHYFLIILVILVLYTLISQVVEDSILFLLRWHTRTLTSVSSFWRLPGTYRRWMVYFLYVTLIIFSRSLLLFHYCFCPKRRRKKIIIQKVVSKLVVQISHCS